MMDKAHIFEIMNGNFIEGTDPELEQYVRSEFTEGSDCMNAYGRIYKARLCLGERLGTGEEDQDIMDIVDCFEALTELVCLDMYDDGAGSQDVLERDKKKRLEQRIREEWTDAVHGAGSQAGGAIARLLQRLGADRDPDIQAIIDGYGYIASRLGEKMYGYGAMHERLWGDARKTR